MDKERQAVYRAMQQGLLSLADSFQIPRIDGHALSDIFFELRLDHPEIFWVSSFKYRYFADSPNLIFIPEYLFEKNKVKEMKALYKKYKAYKNGDWDYSQLSKDLNRECDELTAKYAKYEK